MPGSFKSWAMFGLSVIAVVAVSRAVAPMLPVPDAIKRLLP